VRADHLAGPVPGDYWLHACSGSYTRIARSMSLLNMPRSGGGASRHLRIVEPRAKNGVTCGPFGGDQKRTAARGADGNDKLFAELFLHLRSSARSYRYR
jgi:hypothetical protein